MRDSGKVLVMGGNGFIGRNIVNYFEGNGIDVDIYDLFISDTSVVSYQGNILTDDHLEEIISKNNLYI